MSQNQKLDQIFMKSIFHVRRSQNEPPFLACIQLKPYINPFQDKSQYVQIIAPYSKNNIAIHNQLYSQNTSPLNRINDIDPLQQGLLYSQQNNLNPNHRYYEMNKSSESFDIASFMLIFFTLGSSVTALVFYGMALDYMNYISYGYYFRNYYLIIILIVFYSIVMFFRFVIHFIICFAKSMNSGQRVSLALSFFCPLLKYHLIRRKSNEFGFSLKIILITDGISTFLLLLTGVFCLICFKHALYCRYYYYYYYCYQYDGFLIVGILLLVQIFCQLLGYLLYGKFLKEKLNQENYKKIQQWNNLHQQGLNQIVMVPEISNNVYVDLQRNRQIYQKNEQIRTQNGALFTQNSYRQQYP